MPKKKIWRRCPRCKAMAEVRIQLRLFNLPSLKVLTCCGYELKEKKNEGSEDVSDPSKE